MKTKICHITSVHPQNDIRIYEKECCSLASIGYEVHLVAPGRDEYENKVQIHGIGEKPSSRLKRMLLFSQKAYKTAKHIEAEIYHFHDPELIPYGLKLKRLGKKVIFDSHENILEQFSEKTYIPKGLRCMLKGAFMSYLKYACTKFDAIISVDPYICERYKELNDNVVMVANFPHIQEKKEWRKHDNYIAFAGGISRQWNHDVVINAIEKIDGISYVLCGNADEEYLDYLKTLPGWRKVDYRGKVSHEEALGILSGGLAGVALCSYSKNTNGKQGTLGNTKLFEIMMSGVPVICTDFVQWKQIVEVNECGVCMHYRDEKLLRDTIRKLLSDSKECEQMGTNGMIAVRDYSWEKQVGNLKGLYERITGF